MAVGQSGGVGLNTHPAIGLQGIQVGLGPGVVAQHLPGLGQGCPPSSTGAGRVADVPQQVQRGYLLGQGVSTSCVSWDHITSHHKKQGTRHTLGTNCRLTFWGMLPVVAGQPRELCAAACMCCCQPPVLPDLGGC